MFANVKMAAASSRLQEGCCTYNANPWGAGKSENVSCTSALIPQASCSDFYKGVWSGSACGKGKFAYDASVVASTDQAFCTCTSGNETPQCSQLARLTEMELRAVPRPIHATSQTVESMWMEWTTRFGNSGDRHAFDVFARTVNVVRGHGVGAHRDYYKMTLNKFSAVPAHEFKSRFGFKQTPASKLRMSLKTPSPMLAMSKRAKTPMPVAADWRLKTTVTLSKDQGSCGGCWAFSATSALEGFYARSTGQLESFAVQPFIDCVAGGKNGCNGGEPADVFHYVLDVAKGKVCPFKQIPYTSGSTVENAALKGRRGGGGDDGGGGGNTCNVQCGVSVAFTKIHIIPLKPSDTLAEREDSFMRTLVHHGPISVAVASQDSWSNYHSGVVVPDRAFTDADLNHAVLLVGYGADPALNGKEYWVIKNSWGVDWGESGFFRIPRGHLWGSAQVWGAAGPFGMLAYESPFLS